jgi:hypothetical protein
MIIYMYTHTHQFLKSQTINMGNKIKTLAYNLIPIFLHLLQ